MTIVLPNTSKGPGDRNLFSDVYENDAVLKEKVEELEAKIAGTAHPAKEIATEQSTSSTTFTTLSTADETSGVVLPAGGKIRITYAAIWKSSVEEAGKAAIFLDSTQVQSGNFGASEASAITSFATLATTGSSTQGVLSRGGSYSAFTTAEAVRPVDVFAPAGTYVISVKYRAASGSVTARERKLWVEVLSS